MTEPTTTPKRSRRKYRQLVIEVDQATIDAATQRSSSHCMIADAIRKQHPDVTSVSVDLQTIRFTNPAEGARYVYLTPPQAQRALVNFDQGILPEPFSFKTPAPAQVVNAAQRRKPGEPPKPKRPRRKPRLVDSNGTDVSGDRTHLRSGTKEVPTVEGGRLPPNAALSNTAGKVRRFGLSQLKP